MQMFDFWRYNTHPARLEYKARKIVHLGAEHAFEIFKDRRFRELIRFEEKSEEEQNRIFNELVVTNIIFLTILLERLKQDFTDHDAAKKYFSALRETVPLYFKNYLRNINIPEHHALIWDRLVELRLEEYIEAMQDVRGEFLQQENADLREYALDWRMLLFQAIAFGLYRHLVRGNIKKDDPLFQYLQPYLLLVNKGYLKQI